MYHTMAGGMLCSHTPPIIAQQFPNKSSVLAHSQLPNKATDRFLPFLYPALLLPNEFGMEAENFGEGKNVGSWKLFLLCDSLASTTI